MAYYVNNNVLKDCIRRYQLCNLEDNLEWIPKFLSKKQKEYTKKEITEAELNEFIVFSNRRRREMEEENDKYRKMTPTEKVLFNEEADRTKTELYTYFNKIVVGRANTMFKSKNFTFLSVPERQDVIIDTVYTCFQYCSRFDTEKGTSAFSYITQTATNAIKGFTKKIAEDKRVIVTGYDFLDNMEAGSNTQDEWDN